MAGRRDAKPSPTTEPASATAPPPYYIAEQPLFIGGSQFARAFNPGDRVPAEHVEEHGWANLVRPPDGYEAPAAPPQPSNEPETATGQATSKEGDV